jgi:hypothetical protein
MTRDRDDGPIIDELLSEFDAHDTEQLRSMLLDLRSLSQEPAPTPSADLAALLEGGIATLHPRRRRCRRRGVIFSLALVGLMGTGAGAAAALSPDFRAGTAHIVTGIVNGLSHAAEPAAQPAPRASVVPTHSSGGSANSRSTSKPTSHPTPSRSLPPQAHGGSAKPSDSPANSEATDHPTPPVTLPRSTHAPSKP